MVIVRLTPGFANSIMEFCGGYALARELDEELVLDIGRCQGSAWGYLVDMLNIPDYRKITYYSDNRTDLSMPKELRNGRVIIKIPQYRSLEDAGNLKNDDADLYLCDFFMDQFKYYNKYWGEILPMLSYKAKSKNIEAFKDLIKGRVSVGVHFRRGDMLYADFAEATEDDYYKAAIEYCRKKIDKNAIFCVFSDDIEYAENLLGYDENIRYIHFVGYDDADVEEFICLSLCDHRVRPKSSSYSDLADRVHWGKRRKTIMQGELKGETGGQYKRRLLKERYKVLKWLFITSIVKNKYEVERERVRRKLFNSSYCYLDRILIDRYAAAYNKNNDGHSSVLLGDIFDKTVSPDNAREILCDMRAYELNYKTITLNEELVYRFKKFECYYYLGDYERAIGNGDYIWGWMGKNKVFRREYYEILKELGLNSEADLICCDLNNVSFIIFSDAPSVYSSNLIGLGELAVGLAKMGSEVILVENPTDEVEAIYINKNDFLTNRHEVSYGCRQFMYNYVKERGYNNFIKERIKKGEDRISIVIADDKNVFDDKSEDTVYIWKDNKDTNDPEQSMKNTEKPQLTDYILTSTPEHYTDKSNLIVYNSSTNQQPYWETTKRWQQHDCHRLSERTINICKAIELWCKGQGYV